MSLLTDLERDRLFNRSNEDPRSRATNDRRVRKKLEAWLGGLREASWCLELLPPDQTNKILQDSNIYDLLATGLYAAKIKQFSPISGELGEPETWKLESNPVESLLGMRWHYGDILRKRSVTDLDIYRAMQLLRILHEFNKYFVNTNVYTNMQNPIDVIVGMNFLNPKFDDRLKEDELKGVTKARQAWHAIARKRFDEVERLTKCRKNIHG